MTLVDVHFVFAFMVALCAVVFSWTPLGRRVAAVVLTLGLLTGLGLILRHSILHEPVQALTALHAFESFLALVFYASAVVADTRGANRWIGTALGLLGALTVLWILATGLRMFFSPA